MSVPVLDLYTNAGSFTSPNFPSNYWNDLDLTYTAHLTSPGPQLLHIILDSKLEITNDICFDFVTLFFQNKNVKYCGLQNLSFDGKNTYYFCFPFLSFMFVPSFLLINSRRLSFKIPWRVVDASVATGRIDLRTSKIGLMVWLPGANVMTLAGPPSVHDVCTRGSRADGRCFPTFKETVFCTELYPVISHAHPTRL